MKCYTFSPANHELSEGIAVFHHPDFGWSVKLGDEGRGNIRTHISVDKKFSPKIRESADGDFYLAHSGYKVITLPPDIHHKNGKRFNVLSNVNENRAGAIVWVRGAVDVVPVLWCSVLASGEFHVERRGYTDAVIAMDDLGEVEVIFYGKDGESRVSLLVDGDEITLKENTWKS